MSKLLTPLQLSEIPDLYATEDIKDPMCQLKLFTPDSNWTWYIIKLCQEDKETCFGYVEGLEKELGYFIIKGIIMY